MMNKIVACTSLFLACGGVALAATSTTSTTSTTVNDAPVVVATLMPASNAYAEGNWNGFYVGAGLGYAYGNIDTQLGVRYPNTNNWSGTKTVSDNFHAPQAVGILGYSHTFDRLYLGGELDLGGFIGGDASNSAQRTLNNSTETGTVSASPTWSATPSLLLGALITPKWLVYARAGVPMVGMDSSQSIVSNSGTTIYNHSTSSAFSAGLMGGLGVGYSFDPRFNLRAEDDYSHLWGPTSSHAVNSGGVSSTTTSLETAANEVLVSANYMF